MGFLLRGQLLSRHKPDSALFQLGQDRTAQAGILPLDKIPDFPVQQRQQFFRSHSGR